ncbi:MAG: NAD-dependent epimerase/dehydratase family protein [Candidatus Aureabacteria bacterium]|nr:NAD-dependent epimerase/dehydratase family protein [Candidatus Auribacterota bacterium]
MTVLVTGATGCVGGNLAEVLIGKGHRVRALVRPGSDTGFLRALGLELCPGDLGDRASLARAVTGIDVVFHCAAVVSDWASLEEMHRVNVEGLKNLLDACEGVKLKRFVYMSSMVVLGMGAQNNLDESASYVATGDNYNTTKIEAEKLALECARERGIPVTVVRAPYVYGPRDRQMFPRILAYLKNGRYAFIGGGTNPFSLVYAKNLADGLIRAAESPGAVGQIYNITDGVAVTRRELINLMADRLGLPWPKRNISYPAARVICAVCETVAKVFRLKTAPLLNRFRLKFMYTPLTFDISKARRELGYGPAIPFEKGIEETIEWFKSQIPNQKSQRGK